MIPEEERVVTISHGGYAKTQPLAAYQAQRRGGKGKSATGVKDEDYIAHLLVANSHTTLLLFSSKGKVYWLKPTKSRKPPVPPVGVRWSTCCRWTVMSTSPPCCRSMNTPKVTSSSWPPPRAP